MLFYGLGVFSNPSRCMTLDHKQLCPPRKTDGSMMPRSRSLPNLLSKNSETCFRISFFWGRLVLRYTLLRWKAPAGWSSLLENPWRFSWKQQINQISLAQVFVREKAWWFLIFAKGRPNQLLCPLQNPWRPGTGLFSSTGQSKPKCHTRQSFAFSWYLEGACNALLHDETEPLMFMRTFLEHPSRNL